MRTTLAAAIVSTVVASGHAQSPPSPMSPGPASPAQTAPSTNVAAQQGAIEGRVVGPAGDGLPYVFVRVLSRRDVAGHSYLIPILDGGRLFTGADISETDADGRFEFSTLNPGTYFLVALPQPFARDAYKYLSPSPQGAAGFRPMYYPSAERAAEATPIEVRAGQATRDLTITLPATQTGTITAQILLRSELQGLLAFANLYFAPSGELQPAVRMQRRSGEGTFVFENLPAGEYVLSIDPLRRVTVKPGMTTDVSVLQRVPATLRARLSVEAGVTAPSPEAVSVRFEATDEVGALLFAGRVRTMPAQRLNQAGEFQAPEWLPMPAVMRVEPPAGWTLKAIMLNGHDITNRAIDFTTNLDGIEIVLAPIGAG